MKSNAFSICLCIFFSAIFQAHSQNLNYGDIVITEIMADPSPVINLPDAEFIEIFNNSSEHISLKNCNLIMGDKALNFPDVTFAPQEYAILCASKSVEDFQNYGTTISIPSFASLNNTGKRIAIVQSEKIIASLFYTDEWYQNSFKASGGWSLEKRNIADGSEIMENWAASVDYSGGTPGRENSVNTTIYNNVFPTITNAYFKNDSTLIVTTDQNTDISEVARYETLSISPVDYSLQEYEIALAQKVQPHNIYEIEFTLNCFDLLYVAFEEHIAMFDSLTQPLSVIFQEILFNPHVGESDFVEIQNISNSYYNLADIYIAKPDFSSLVPLSNQPKTIAPQQTVLLTEDPAFWEAQSNCYDICVLPVNLPTLADDTGSLLLLNKWGEIIDSITYFASWHNEELEDVDGISLQRIQKIPTPTPSANWTSSIPTPACENTDMVSVEIEIDPITLSIAFVSNVEIMYVCSSLCNMAGTVVNRSTFTPCATSGTIAMDYSRVSTGMYIQTIHCTLKNGENKNVSRLIIKR